MPPSSSGKADGTTIIEGGTIPSQYVDASKHYFTGRRIDMLRYAGALGYDATGSLAVRADGIIANLPANGRLEAAELARMEKPEIFATLFPEEQMALPTLWALLEAPYPWETVNALPLDVTITDQHVEPSGLVVPPSLLISSLPPNYQTLAKRVQLVFNGDANADTIQIADIDSVLVMPQAFTPGEVQDLKVIRLIFIERATSNCEAKVVVPEPGHKSAVTTFGTMSLELTTEVAIRERRVASATSFDVSMTLETDQGAKLTSPAGGKLVGIVLGTGAEFLIQDGQLYTRDGAATVVERYVNGVRQEAHYLALPAIKPGHMKYPMTQYVDFSLVTANNTPLVKYPVAHPNNASATIIDFEYGVTAMPNPLVDFTLLATVATPGTHLPTGRYVLPDSVKMDVYPGSVVFFNGLRATLGFTQGNRVVRAGNNDWQDTLTLSSGELYSWRRYGQTTRFTALASMRTQ